MKYNKMVGYFQSPEGLEQLIVDYKDLFDQIEDYGQQLLQGILTTSEDFKGMLNFMTGSYVSLEPLYSIAESTKLNEELKNYVGIKRDLESKGEKVVAANLEKEASLSVADFRRVRAVLEGYVLATEKAIVTSQTQLKRLEQDERFKPQEQK
jgi:hypothetical protein